MGATPAHPNAAELARLEQSRQRWVSSRTAWDDRYAYTVAWQSAFGFGHETRIEVHGAVVQRRSFRAWQRGDAPASALQQTAMWTEQQAQLGQHKEQAAPALTIDQLYERCQSLLLTARMPTQRLTLSFDERGILRACYKQDTRIADDAPAVGVPFFSLAAPGQD